MENIEVLKFVVGSKLFKLDTADSDTDFLCVYINPDQATNPAAKTTAHVEDKENNTETIHVELNTFMRAVASDLKYREALGASVNLAESSTIDFDPFLHYVNSVDYSQVYVKEITRRYNKTWYATLNPNAKNYNAEQGYDSKFAAHLFRVLTSAQHYVRTGEIKTDFSDVRQVFLDIRSGVKDKESVYQYTTDVKESVLHSLNAKTPTEPLPVPVRWYFEQVLKLS